MPLEATTRIVDDQMFAKVVGGFSLLDLRGLPPA